MMRTPSLLALGLLAGAAAFGATPWEATTYVDGNVKDLPPNTGGTLQFPDDKTMYFNAGAKSIPVPYASIDKADLGPTKTHSRDIPLYKIWALPKRFTGKTQTQYLSLQFKTTDGEENNMTLELPLSTAPAVLSKIQINSGMKSAAATKPLDHDEGWGEDFWKTTRNADKWNTKTVASNQQ
ncbi:MAG: hypothetical protein ABSB35_37830 [Bryobacteraceae bacterium]|jgi:hypothetical protein